MWRVFLLFTIFFFNSNLFFCQGQGISLGDQFPSITFDQTFGTLENKVTIPDNSGKFLILDFWGTACSICIKNLSKIDSIENSHLGRIKIVPVIDQGISRQKLATFWWNNKLLSKSKSWTVIDSSKLLKNIFPRSGVPYYVFIDQFGRYRGRGGHDYFNSAIINRLVEDSSFYVDGGPPQVFFHPIKELFEKQNLIKGTFPFLCDYQIGVFKDPFFSNIVEYKNGNSLTRVFQFVNVSVEEFYQFTFDMLNGKKNKRKILFNLPDSIMKNVKRSYAEYEREWNLNNAFCAEFYFPADLSEKSCAASMIQILNDKLGLMFDIKKGEIYKNKIGSP